MREATRVVAIFFGVIAGIAGALHGCSEIAQGHGRPAGLMFASIGPPCVPERAWNGCEPAMSVVPDLRTSGSLAVLFGLAMIVWAASRIRSSFGGAVLMLLSLVLLLFGGGFFPPLIGLVAGAAGTRVDKAPGRAVGRLARWSARLWPWPLVVFVVWVLGQFALGYFFNDFLRSVMGFGLLLILTSLPLAVYAAYAHDACRARPPDPGER